MERGSEDGGRKGVNIVGMYTVYTCTKYLV